MMDHYNDFDEDTDSDEEEAKYSHENRVQWKNIVFIPFHPLFKFISLLVAIVKCLLGPISSISKAVYCDEYIVDSKFVYGVLLFYRYMCTPIFVTDMILHIMHRQVPEIAVQREHVPKSGVALLIDFIALLPLFSIGISEDCPDIQLWPNILTFNEILVLYRVVEFFNLLRTHSIWNITIGVTVVVMIILNCFTSFWILLSIHGICPTCKAGKSDWRAFLTQYVPDVTIPSVALYSYGASLLSQPFFSCIMSNNVVQVPLGFLILNVITVLSYCTCVFVILPKLFGESLLRFRKLCSFQPHVVRVVDESRRRNIDEAISKDIENFYQLVWLKRSGITGIPKIMFDLPAYLITDIKLDLTWPLFYHSPTFRRTTDGFRRWIAKKVKLYYKAPGDILTSRLYYSGCFYYIKTGIVQMISNDDANTPLLSVTSGSIFGDVNFLFPPMSSKLIVRCLTYCEIHIILRKHILKSLQKFPHDRREIFRRVDERLEHARHLHYWKTVVTIQDRTELEGIYWIKDRWWTIAEIVTLWKKYARNVSSMAFEIPTESKRYHCSKYIGQLVLCRSAQLQNKAIFIKSSFPWIMSPTSDFVKVWHNIIRITICLVLIIFPPCIKLHDNEAEWFLLFKFWTSVIYVIDIFVALVTPTTECQNITDFYSVLFARAKTLSFLLDIASTPIVEAFVGGVGLTNHIHLAKFSPILKIYFLFANAYNSNRLTKVSPFKNVCFLNLLLMFSFVYVTSYMVYLASQYIQDISIEYFFLPRKGLNMSKAINIVIAWHTELSYHYGLQATLTDIYLKLAVVYVYFFISMYVRSEMIAMVYLKNREIVNTQYFINSILDKYKAHNLDFTLRRRLQNYFLCHWKIYKGLDIKHVNNMLKDEPSEIFYKVYGLAAVKLISNSQAFRGANINLIKEIAMHSKFLVVPQNSTLNSFETQCELLIWILHGEVRSEYYDANGEIISHPHEKGEVLNMCTVLLGKRSLKKFIAQTDCEIIYIDLILLNEIIDRYPNEKRALTVSIEECKILYDELIAKFTRRAEKVKRQSVKVPELTGLEKFKDFFVSHLGQSGQNESSSYSNRFKFQLDAFWIDPNNWFYQVWMPIRAITVVCSIMCCVAEGTYGARHRSEIHYLTILCDCAAWFDIGFKFFLAYYNEQGILIMSYRKIFLHYLVRGFVADVIGVFPWIRVMDFLITTPQTQSFTILWDSYTRSVHLYLFIGYCNYMCDLPDRNTVLIKIVKWQVVSFLMMNVMALHLSSICMTIDWEEETFEFIRINLVENMNETCFFLGEPSSVKSNDVMFTWINNKSFLVAQYSFMKLIISKYTLEASVLSSTFITYIAFLAKDILYWFVQIYTIAMLVLQFRGPSLFEDNINQLVRFLKNERVDNSFIETAGRHFKYWWLRTNGMSVINPMMERVGMVLRQDIALHFFETTLENLSENLNLSEHIKSNLACMCEIQFFLPGHDIMRQHTLVPFIYIVHRGRVTVIRNGKKIESLKKCKQVYQKQRSTNRYIKEAKSWGAVFGQLQPGRLQPVKITVRADESADILQITAKNFFRIADSEIIKNIQNCTESAMNYIPLKGYYMEMPQQSIEYLMRGTPTVKFPRMDFSVTTKNNRAFAVWLTMAWLVLPALASFASLVLCCRCPRRVRNSLRVVCITSDIGQIALMIIDIFFTQHLVIVDDRLVYHAKKWKVLKSWTFYADMVSILVAWMRFVMPDRFYHMVRCIRLRYFYDYYKHFCKNFQSKIKRMTLFVVCTALSMHVICCLDLIIRCQDLDSLINSDVPNEIVLQNIDIHEFVTHDMREGGCILTRYINTSKLEGTFASETALIVFKHKDWFGDYLHALTHLIQFDVTNISLTVRDDYLSNWLICLFSLSCNYTIYAINIFIMSKALTLMYIKFRKMIHYDYESRNLQRFLLDSKLTITLLRTVQIYLSQLWQRQKGNWIPELVSRAPLCLQQDIMCSLYLHHFKIPSTFKNLPSYFLRQLTAKMHRTVIFPGKDIVKEGDVLPVIFFIHEGEVEKYYRDKNGEKRILTILTTTGYFELIPAIFPNTPYQYSYQTRSVVDLVYLRYADWKELLDVYPDIKLLVHYTARSARDHTIKI